jgi:hypothetical protein
MINRSISQLLFFSFIVVYSCINKPEIDRYKLVARCKVQKSTIDGISTIPVGNGRYIFYADITGLQTFHRLFAENNPSGILSEWRYNKFENPQELIVPQFLKPFIVHGRKIEFMRFSDDYRNAIKTAAADWTGNSGHHFNPGIIELLIKKENGKEISIDDIRNPVQKLDLLTWEIDSRFYVEDIPVHVRTVCHSDYDMLSVKISSELIGEDRLKIRIYFPSWTDPAGDDYASYSGKHVAEIISDTNNMTLLSRRELDDTYNVLVWKNGAVIKEVAPCSFLLEPGKEDSIYSFSCQFLKKQDNGRIQTFGETEMASRRSWQKFWNACSVSDIQTLTQNIGGEAERLLIISKYLTEQNDVHEGKNINR